MAEFWLNLAEHAEFWLNFGWKCLNLAESGLKSAKFSHFQPNSAVLSHFQSAIFSQNSAIFSQIRPFPAISAKMHKMGCLESGQLWLRMAEPEFWVNSQDQPKVWHVESSSSGWEWLGNPRAFGQKHAGSYIIIKEFSCSLGLGENTFCRNKKTEIQKNSSLICHMQKKNPH